MEKKQHLPQLQSNSLTFMLAPAPLNQITPEWDYETKASSPKNRNTTRKYHGFFLFESILQVTSKVHYAPLQGLGNGQAGDAVDSRDYVRRALKTRIEVLRLRWGSAKINSSLHGAVGPGRRGEAGSPPGGLPLWLSGRWTDSRAQERGWTHRTLWTCRVESWVKCGSNLAFWFL